MAIGTGYSFILFFFKQKTAYEIGLGIPAEPLFRSLRLKKLGQDRDDVFHRILRMDNVDLILAAVFRKLFRRGKSLPRAYVKSEAGEALSA